MIMSPQIKFDFTSEVMREVCFQHSWTTDTTIESVTKKLPPRESVSIHFTPSSIKK